MTYLLCPCNCATATAELILGVFFSWRIINFQTFHHIHIHGSSRIPPSIAPFIRYIENINQHSQGSKDSK